MLNYGSISSKSLSINAFNFTPMEKLHRGNKLERLLRAEGVNFMELSSKIEWRGKRHINRMTLYNWFKDPDLPIDKILAVAKVMPEVAEAFDEIDTTGQLMDQQADYLKEEGTLSAECQKQINYWRNQAIKMHHRVMELQDTIIELKTAQ